MEADQRMVGCLDLIRLIDQMDEILMRFMMLDQREKELEGEDFPCGSDTM